MPTSSHKQSPQQSKKAIRDWKAQILHHSNMYIWYYYHQFIIHICAHDLTDCLSSIILFKLNNFIHKKTSIFYYQIKFLNGKAG